jgi:2-amino-4-hydroxy-6-hydroxymethyldihydropteridine diphosphokinase
MECQVFIGLGSNLGDSRANIARAQELLRLPVLAASSLFETEPVGYKEQPWFVNAVVRVGTDLAPQDLLLRCRDVEEQMKRQRRIPMGPRTIDLDILFYGCLVVEREDLHIPHRAVAERRFVLVPMVEIAPDFVHPVLNRTVAEMLETCPDRSEVRKL